MPFFRAPGLPFFIVAATVCHTQMIWLVKIALAIIDSMSVALVFLLAEKLFLDRRVSLLCATGAAIYPFFVAQVCDLQTEGLFMFLFLLSIYLTLRAVGHPSPHLTLGAGVGAGAAALVRPIGLVLLLLLPATLVHLGWAKKKEQLQLITWFVIGATVCLGPWAVRNGLRYHEFILVNDAGGYNFWRGTSPEMAEINQLADQNAFSSASIQFETVISPAIAREIDRTASTPSSRNREWYRLAFRNLGTDPEAFGLRLVRNALAYWRPWLNPQTYSRIVVAISGIMMMSLEIFALVGWNLLRKRDAKLAWWCAMGALLFWILQIPFQVVSRFRIPITDPFLIILAAASLTALFRRSLGVRCPTWT